MEPIKLAWIAAFTMICVIVVAAIHDEKISDNETQIKLATITALTTCNKGESK